MFDRLVGDARAFLADLDRNNSRDWFQAHKATYDRDLRDPAKALLETMAPRIAGLTGYAAATKLFRINRDVRFSKDKTPYNTHLHMMWPISADTRQDPVMFFGIGLDYVTAGTGIMGFDKPVLEDWRRMVDGDGDRMAGIIAAVEAQGFDCRAPELKRVPPPHEKDHPHAGLLRHKGLVLSGELPGKGPLEGELFEAFKALWPVADMLIGVTEAPGL